MVHRGAKPNLARSSASECIQIVEAIAAEAREGDVVIVIAMLNCGAMWREAGMVIIAFGLAKVVIADAVDKDHQHRPSNEEQGQGRKRIDEHADLQRACTEGQPINRGSENVLTLPKVIRCNGRKDDEHAHQPGKRGGTHSDTVTKLVIAVGEQDY